MKEFPIQGCFKFDGKNQYDLITYLKKNRTSNDIISTYDNFVGWNSKFYWFCQSSLKTEYKWEELSKFVTKTVSMEEKHEDYTGRTIKALINSPQATRVKLGEEIKILKVTGSNNYVLDENAEGTPGMWITKPLNLEQWELLPEKSDKLRIKDSDVVDMKAIQEECIIRFPIGCIYIDPGDSVKVTRTLKDDFSTYDIYGSYIYAHNGGGCLYKNGVYAALVSLPEEKTIKQNLIVGRWYKYKGWYIKYKETACGLFKSSEEITDDKKYYKSAGSYGKADHEKVLLEDLSEIQAYLPDGHPDKLSKPSIPEYVECISDIHSSIHLGGIYKLNPSSTNHRYSLKNVNIGTYSSSFFKPSTKEAYDAQFVVTSSILPKKWCLKITSSNQEVLNKWRKRQPNFFEKSIGFTGWLLSDAHDGTYTHWDNNVPVGYTEITLQQFYDNVHPIDVYDIIKKESSVYVHDSYETVKTKPLIENVHSVSVKLSTKKINNKFKF